jgi:hypothetical protein
MMVRLLRGNTSLREPGNKQRRLLLTRGRRRVFVAVFRWSSLRERERESKKKALFPFGDDKSETTPAGGEKEVFKRKFTRSLPNYLCALINDA